MADRKPGEVKPSEASTANSDPERTAGASSANASPSPSRSSKQKATAKKAGVKYYRSRLHGLSVVVNNDLEDPDPTTAVEKVRFEPFQEKFQGDDVKVGYLATDNKRAQELLDNDPSVEELTKDEYEKATDTEREKNPAKRAAY